jgi:NAD(P)-dependent dehydrogenase (short-subunit alcohol dehydrogenase family)
MYSDLEGKTALITGGGLEDGIGFATARKLAENGVHIILTDLCREPETNAGVKQGTMKSLQNLATKLGSTYGVKVLPLALDVTDNQSISAMVQDVKAEFERVDILFNNAGVSIGVPSPIHDYDEASWLKTIEVSLHGTFRVTKAMLPLMFGKPVSIINNASKAGKSPLPLNGAYAVAKAGVIMLTKVMAKELGGVGVRVNALCPGLIMTGLQKWRFELEAEIFDCSPEERQQEKCKEVPLGYLGTADQVADLAVYLASESSSYITGQAINVCGGQLLEL